MPFRFRRSVRLWKGTRLNLSKRGANLSQSVLPGLTYTTASRGRSRKSTGGCFLGTLLVLPFQITWWTLKLLGMLCVALWQLAVRFFRFATATPARRKVSLIATVGVLGLCGVCSLANEIYLSAPAGQAEATARARTQTAAPSRTPLLALATWTTWPSWTPAPSWTPRPTRTAAPVRAIALPTDTPFVLLPSPTAPALATAAPQRPTLPAQDSGSALQQHPAGTSGQCRDGSYTRAAHKQGACSSHGGVAAWWGS